MADDNFFEQFSGFEPNSSALVVDEFARLASHMRWKAYSKAWKRNRERCFKSEFITHFGRDASRLENWQSLCEEVGVKRIPDSIAKCRKARNPRGLPSFCQSWLTGRYYCSKALRNFHVNLVDLIDCRRAGTRVHRFSSAQALREYTANTPGKIFPKRAAKEDGFLKALLRDIF